MSAETTPDACIFCRIVRGEVPAQKVYEDAEILAFRDVRPAAAVHVLVVPKQHIATLYDTAPRDAALLGRMVALLPRIASEQGATDGFRTIVNTGRVGGQEVYHLHIHVIGGPKPLGPMIVRQ